MDHPLLYAHNSRPSSSPSIPLIFPTSVVITQRRDRHHFYPPTLITLHDLVHTLSSSTFRARLHGNKHNTHTLQVTIEYSKLTDVGILIKQVPLAAIDPSLCGLCHFQLRMFIGCIHLEKRPDPNGRWKA